MDYQARYAALRENPDTARAGMKWMDDEVAELMERVTLGMDINDIARAHKRTVTGVKSRMMSIALDMMEKNNISLEDASTCVNIPLEELQAFKERRDEKNKVRPTRSTAKKHDKTTEENHEDKYMSILGEIRDLLKYIATRSPSFQQNHLGA